MNFAHLQSAYRLGKLTETALLHAMMDAVYRAVDNEQAIVLVGLDISAAFDSVAMF
jgi:hypothetical protein